MTPTARLLAGALVALCAAAAARALNPVLDLNRTFPYLVNRTSGRIIEPSDYMNFEDLYAPSESYRRNQTAQGRNYHLLKAFDFANYYQSDYWHYSSEEDLRLSARPVANASLCARHLDWLERQLNSSASLWRPGEQHVNLATLVDAFGKPEAGTYLGHGYWFGSYYECKRNAIDLDAFEREECRASGGCAAAAPTSAEAPATVARAARQPPAAKTGNLLKSRYCVGKVREADWPQDDYVPKISYKVGLCLPESCETLSFGQHRDQLQRIMRFNLPEHLKPRMHLFDMYCLPDERSPIRQWKLSSRIFLGLCALWLVALVGATSIFSCYKRHQKDIRNIIKSEQLQRDLDLSQCVQEQSLLAAAEHLNAAHHTQQPPPSEAAGAAKTPASHADELAEEPPTSPVKELISNGAQLLMIKTQASLAGHHLSESSPRGLGSPSSLLHHSGAIKLSPLIGAIPLPQGVANLHQVDLQSNASSNRTSSSSLTNWLNESPMLIRVLRALSIVENLREFQQPPAMLRQPDASKRLRVNLNALDSIKCLCCVLVIFGHIVFIHMQHLSNIVHTIELSHEIYPRVLIAFFNFVDTFFIISGMLTSYFVFKRFTKTTFASPLVWLHISALRLLRLSPVYLLVFWFAKTSSVYLAEGPVWDYGTDAQSNKGLCINDHWWKSLLYLGNWGTMQPLCILPAWSIIVDSQYSLVVPPLLYLLFRHRRLGYLVLLLAVLVSTANMSLMLATQRAVKTTDMAKIRLHVYPLISRFAAEFYNTAWNRVGPVAIGIVGGHMLYLYDVGRVRHWPWFMRGLAFKLCLLLHGLIFVLPAIGRFTDSPTDSAATGPQDSDMTIFVLSNATIKPVWSLINTIFLLRLVTDLRERSVLARLMSHNLWHCAGKLCFASYLIHYEIILMLLKSRQDGLVDPNWSNALREFSAAFLISTLVSYFIYVLYESPINKLISLLLVRSGGRDHEHPAAPCAGTETQLLGRGQRPPDGVLLEKDKSFQEQQSESRKHIYTDEQRNVAYSISDERAQDRATLRIVAAGARPQTRENK